MVLASSDSNSELQIAASSRGFTIINISWRPIQALGRVDQGRGADQRP